ncbi:MAG: Gfo/Idh/MocA family oxidoreductase [Candidatus Liptonbacteria bacterium]|nr:Gfo/Idh/MocA family oxidoreductase [Candidatus Liptonbacteria bacterium]
MNEVKFAILGCGKIGSRHAEKLQNVNGAKLVAVCDLVSDRVDAIVKKYQGVKAYYNAEDLVKDDSIDLINICTPSGLHPEHSIAALNAKKHVLCEKPMAFTEKDARAMIDAAYRNQKFLYVVKQNR